MNLAAVLQIVGLIVIVVAAAIINLILAVFVAGVALLAFGIWEEVGS